MSATKTNQLIEYVEEIGLEGNSGLTIKEKFLPLFEQAEEWKNKAKGLVVTSADQVEEMKQAREARLILKRIRVDADKVRKELKADSLRYGKAVQGVYNVIEYLITPIEKHLQEQEDFVKNLEAERIENLRIVRLSELEKYAEFVPYGIDNIGNYPEDEYLKLSNSAKSQFEAKQAEAERIEAERIEKIEAERIERERIEKENAELKKQAAKREKEIEAARIKAEKAEAERLAEIEKIEAEKAEIIRKAQEEKQRSEAEAKAKAEAEERKEAERLAAERKAAELIEAEEKRKAAAPDKAKLIEFAKQIGLIDSPKMETTEGLKILTDAQNLSIKLQKFIMDKAAEL